MSDPNGVAERFARLSVTPMRTIGATSGSGLRGFARSMREVAQRRELLWLLVKRDLKARYKDSALGFLWVLARPLVQLAIYFVVLGQFLGAARGIPDFAVYVFAGLTAMGLFQEIAVGGTGSILDNGGVVKKVYMPREVFPLASAGSALVNFGIQLVVLIIATVIVGKPPLHLDLLYAIPSIAVILVYGLAFALLLGATNVYLRDIQYLVEVGTMLLFWVSPVVYSWQMAGNILSNPVLLEIYTDNPLTLGIIGFQRAFWIAGDHAPEPGMLWLRLLIALVVGLIALFLAHRVFAQLQGNFAQEL
jgi:ABC-2 type transport system permease protein